MLLQALREELIFYGKEMLKSGLTMHTGGNLSVRDRETGYIAIKPSSVPYEQLQPEDIPIIDLDGNVIDGNRRLSSEWPMHTLIYRTYPRVCGVVHCHSLYACAYAAAGVEIPLIGHELCMYCSSPVRIAPFCIPGSEELGESAIAAFGNDNCVALLQNHGPIAMGATLWHAFDAACAVEQAAKIHHIASHHGTPHLVPEEGRKVLRACDPLQQPDTGKVEIRAI